MMDENEIRRILAERFAPETLEVVDESYKHVGHPETMRSGHGLFDVEIVSSAFAGQPLLQRHRAIYAALGMGGNNIHGLTVRAHTPAEWARRHRAA